MDGLVQRTVVHRRGLRGAQHAAVAEAVAPRRDALERRLRGAPARELGARTRAVQQQRLDDRQLVVEHRRVQQRLAVAVALVNDAVAVRRELLEQETQVADLDRALQDQRAPARLGRWFAQS